MEWLNLDISTLRTMAVAVAASASCAIIGCFLVIRGMSLLGDAISHAVLPGIVVAFLLADGRHPVPLLVGAIAAGILTTFLTQSLHRRAGVQTDAGMGVVFTALFAGGVVMISAFDLTHVDLDPDCVLFGDLGVAALRTARFGGFEFPQPLIPLGIAFGLNAALIGLLWKELKITSFDPQLATTLGISSTIVHYAVMSAVSCTAVAAFESVGSILVISMLIVPGATARLLTDRLFPMVVIAAGAATVAAVAGILIAGHFDTVEAPTLSVASGVLFAITVIAAPRHGLLAAWIRRLLLSLRIVAEDVLARVYRHQERQRVDGKLPILGLTFRGLSESVREGAILGGRNTCRVTLWILGWRGLLTHSSSGYLLTDAGLSRAADLIRSHRAWEVYLRENLGVALDHLHEPAHRMEHFLTPELTQDILADAGDLLDPHGRPIPLDAAPSGTEVDRP